MRYQTVYHRSEGLKVRGTINIYKTGTSWPISNTVDARGSGGLMVEAETESNEVIRAIAANLKAARKRRKMTQAALAAIASIDLSYVQRVERGRQNLTIKTLARIAAAVGVQVHALLLPSGSDEVQAPERQRGDNGHARP